MTIETDSLDKSIVKLTQDLNKTEGHHESDNPEMTEYQKANLAPPLKGLSSYMMYHRVKLI